MGRPESFRQLTISVERLPALMAREAKLASYAADRARLLLGCYRKGEANDPETYVAAITATLSRYPEEVITAVTHPASGLPVTLSWLPTVKDVKDACETALYPIRQRELRDQRVTEQLALRDQDIPRNERPTFEELKAKYGDNWGLQPTGPGQGDKAGESREALARAQERVRREYAADGRTPPSPLALSPTALKAMARIDAERNGTLIADRSEAAA